MMLVELSAIPAADLPLAALKAHLRLGAGFTDDSAHDALLVSYLRAAMAAVETRIGKVLMTRRMSWSVESWTKLSCQTLPVAPVVAIHSVILEDRNGGRATLNADTYRLIGDDQRPRLAAKGAALPRIPTDGVAFIEFDAGFGAIWDDVPAALQQAVFLLAAQYFESRRDTSAQVGALPFGVAALLEPFRRLRLFGARI